MNILEKYFQIFGSFSFFTTSLKTYKTPFHKKNFQKIPEVSEICENKVL